MTVAVFWTSESEKSAAVKIGVAPPMMFGSLVASSAAGLPKASAVLADFTYAQRTWFLSAVSVIGSEYSCTPGVPPFGALSAPLKEAVLPDTYALLPPLMRACDSSTATATGSAVAPPVSTSAVASEGWLMVVGCSAGSISVIGASELPPETDDSVPIRFRSRPCAPALAMPYMGLCGLFWVSFCDMAHSTAPLVPAAVAGVAWLRIARLRAPPACHRRPREASMLALELGTMLPGNPTLPQLAVGRKFRLPP